MPIPTRYRMLFGGRGCKCKCSYVALFRSGSDAPTVPRSRFPVPNCQCQSSAAQLPCPGLDDIAFRCAHAFCPRPVFLFPVPGGHDTARLDGAVCPKISIVFGRRVGESGRALLSSSPMMSDGSTLVIDLHLEPVASRRFLPAAWVVHALRVHACFSLCRAVGPPHRHVTGSRRRSRRPRSGHASCRTAQFGG
jgi:hypothetical protein